MAEGDEPPTDEEIRLAERELDLAGRRTLDALQRWLSADNANLAHCVAWLESTRQAEATARARLEALRARRQRAQEAAHGDA